MVVKKRQVLSTFDLFFLPPMTYKEQLANPKWQKRRLEILQRDGFACQMCGDTETELHVHHKNYKGLAWQADDEDLQTMCAHCHSYVEEMKASLSDGTLGILGALLVNLYDDCKDTKSVAYLLRHKSGKTRISFVDFYKGEIQISFSMSPNVVPQISRLINNNTNG